MAIGANIKRIRTLKNVKVADLASATGIKPESIYAWERGQYNPNEENLQALAAALGVPIKDFYDENHASVQNEPAVSEKDKIMKALQDAMAEGSSYMVIPKTVLDGEYRIVPEREYIMREREIGIREKEQEESNKAMDVMVKYIANLERDNAELERENADLRSQIAAPPMPPQSQQ